jgi:hypothetical protein
MSEMNAKLPMTTTPSQRRPKRTDAARLPFRWAGASRTREGELYRRVVRQLVAHVGGRPSATEEYMIGQIAWLQVHLAHLNEAALKKGVLSNHAQREYLAWSNAYVRALARLGIKGAAAKGVTATEYFAGKRSVSARSSSPEEAA